MGQSIYTAGPSNVNTGRIGTVEEANSGPNFMAVYVNPNDKTNNQRWLVVTDGACQVNNNGGGYSSSAAGGSMRACTSPADPSVAGTLVAKGTFTTPSINTNFPPPATVTNYVSQQNPLLSTANCTNPGPQYLTSIGLPTKTVCYPQNHQSNVKVFDLKSNSFVAVFPTGGGCIDQGFQNSVGAGSFQIQMAPCSAPLGLYAPPSAAAPYGYSVTGNLGRAGARDIAIGVDSHEETPGKVYVLVVSPNDNTISQYRVRFDPGRRQKLRGNHLRDQSPRSIDRRHRRLQRGCSRRRYHDYGYEPDQYPALGRSNPHRQDHSWHSGANRPTLLHAVHLGSHDRLSDLPGHDQDRRSPVDQRFEDRHQWQRSNIGCWGKSGH